MSHTCRSFCLSLWPADSPSSLVFPSLLAPVSPPLPPPFLFVSFFSYLAIWISECLRDNLLSHLLFPLFSLSSFSNTLSLCSFFLLILIFSFIRLICMTVNPFAKHPCVKKRLYTFIFSLWRQIWKDQDPFNVCELGTAMWRLASPSMKINAAFQLPRKSDVGTGSDTTPEVSFFQW